MFTIEITGHDSLQLQGPNYIDRLRAHRLRQERRRARRRENRMLRAKLQEALDVVSESIELKK